MRIRLQLAIVAVVLAAMAGCSDKKKKSDQVPAPPSIEGLAAVPASAEVVIGFNVDRLLGSPIIERALERMFQRDPGLRTELETVLQTCELDVKKDVQAAVLALLPTATGRESLLVARGNFREAAITACLQRFLSESGSRLETAEVGGRAIYHKAPQGQWLAFPAERTLLVASTREALVQALESGTSLKDPTAKLAEVLGRVDMQAGIWAMGLLEGPVGQGLVNASGNAVQAPTVFVGHLRLEAGLDLGLSVQLQSSKDAETLKSQADTQIGAMALILQSQALGPLIERISVQAENDWLQLRWTLSEAELVELMAAKLPGLGSAIDSAGGNDQNPSPAPGLAGEAQGSQEDGQRDPTAGDEASVHEQRQADR